MIEDIANVLIYLVSELIIYLLVYAVVFESRFHKSRVRWIGGIGCTIIIHFLLLFLYGKYDAMGFTFISMAVIPILLLDSNKKKHLLLYPFITICASVASVSGSFILALFLGKSAYEIVNGSWMTVGCQGFSIILLLALSVYKKDKKENFTIHISSKQYLIFYVVAISEFLMLGSIQLLSGIGLETKLINISGATASVACITLVAITLWQGIVVNREACQRERNELNEQYMQLQKDYYNQLMEQDEKMRRFRHDMNAHITAMNAYCMKSDSKSLKAYMENVMEKSALYDVEVYTGNKAVDAVLRQLVLEAERKQIQMELEGSIPAAVHISDYDLCTIISNLLKNAIEACDKIISDEHEKRITVRTGVFQSQLYIQCRNSMQLQSTQNALNLISSKKDIHNHGIGTKNIEDSVKKYHGIYDHYIENGWFVTEISI
ncbi:MAG: GHKL domain-containing protein [Lachnospira sp.]|nr:GHKL domain-containing protein [Lachnospira sp.]